MKPHRQMEKKNTNPRQKPSNKFKKGTPKAADVTLHYRHLDVGHPMHTTLLALFTGRPPEPAHSHRWTTWAAWPTAAHTVETAHNFTITPQNNNETLRYCETHTNRFLSLHRALESITVFYLCN